MNERLRGAYVPIVSSEIKRNIDYERLQKPGVYTSSKERKPMKNVNERTKIGDKEIK